MEASDTVGELIALQEIDLEILKIRRELGELDEEITDLKAGVEELEGKAATLTAQAESADERVRKYQRSVQAGRATLKRLETRSAEVKNMQQHFAVRSETDTARRNLRMAEDEALSAMQEQETAREALKEIETRLEEAREELTRRSAEAAAARSALEADLAARSDRKRAQEERLDRSALRLYQSVRSGRSDSALAELTADGVCGRCFTAVPKQRQADIRAGRGLAVCEGCGVILYPAQSGG
ncbi:MAG: C4-type zinc ribbon domain-containing protein [Gemmatimonadota bacterium]|nr:C4-type zinc ribbon domain-containing protein [Gemmatimonadota bacterium]